MKFLKQNFYDIFFKYLKKIFFSNTVISLLVYGPMEYFVVVGGYWYLTPSVSSYPTLFTSVFMSVKAAKELLKKKEERRPRYLLYFNFISGFANISVSDEIILESKWNGRVSQTRCWNVFVVSGGW